MQLLELLDAEDAEHARKRTIPTRYAPAWLGDVMPAARPDPAPFDGPDGYGPDSPAGATNSAVAAALDDQVRETKKPVRAIDLSGTKLTSQIVSTLQKHRGLERLSLAGTAVGDPVLGGLAVCKGIKVLDLRMTRVTNAGLTALNLPALEELYLDDCPLLTTDVVAALTRFKLKRLTLGGVKGKATGLLPLRQMPGLTVLALDRIPVTDAVLTELTRGKHLTGLSLRGTDVTNTSVHELGQMKSLAQIDLRGADAGNSALTHLAGLDGLVWLKLAPPKGRETRVTDAGVEELSRGRAVGSLRVLGLVNTAVSNAAVPRLLKLTGLTELDLSGCKLSDAGLDKLRTGLPGCQVFPR